MRYVENMTSIILNGVQKSQSIPLVLIFISPWSAFSEAIKIISEKVKASKSKVEVLIVDIEEHPEQQTKFNINRIPTFVFIQDHQIKAKVEGMLSKREILSIL